MRSFARHILSVTLPGLLLFTACSAPVYKDGKINYPQTPTVDHVDDYNGVKVADPYHWMEDLDSAQTRNWVAAENRLTFGYLGQIPQRDSIRHRLTKLWDYEKFGIPFKEGGRYFMSKNNGLQNQSVLYTMDSLDAAPRLLLDPNTLSRDGTVALSAMAISKDGNELAYGLATAGSDWVEFRVRDVATGKDRPDHIKWVKFSGASWTADNKGFFYSRYDEPKGNQLATTNYYQKLYYHALGSPQSDDRLVYHRDDQKEWGFGGSVTDDGHYLIIHISQGTERKNRIFYQDLAANDGKTVELLNDFDAEYDFIDNDGPVFWFRTDLDAPRSRIIAIDTRQPQRANWKELVPEAKETLQSVSMVNNQFIADYLKDAHSQIKVFDVNGKWMRDVELPGIGSGGGFPGKRTDKITFYSYTSFCTPPRIYKYDTETGASTLFRQPKVDFNPDDYETKQVFYSSKDGTQIPMFITCRKGLTLDGHCPTFLYGYGGFNISITPTFSVGNLVWMEMGGVYAVPNIRGGGEYGKAWHDAGRLRNKQNVFDDFIAAGEWLVHNGYTSPERLAIGGGSNGGLLVGACLTQRPDLFRAAIPMVGVLDMLRFNKYTIGWAWMSDYGNPEKPDDFKVLYAYSPLHHVKPGTKYPSVLITTGDHDDRVVPSHSFKFAAALQKAQAGVAPVLIRIETRAGHGAGKPTTKQIEEAADRWAFLIRALELKNATIPG